MTHTLYAYLCDKINKLMYLRTTGILTRSQVITQLNAVYSSLEEEAQKNTFPPYMVREIKERANTLKEEVKK